MNTARGNSKQYNIHQLIVLATTPLILKVIFEPEAWINDRFIRYTEVEKSQYKQGLHCSSSQGKIRDLKQLQRRRHRQRKKTIGFMSKTTALHVHRAF